MTIPRRPHAPRLVRAFALAALASLLVPAAGRAITFSSALSSIKVNVKPGQVVTRQFELTLAKDQPRTFFRARVEDWWRSEDGRESFFAEPGTLQQSCAPWVTINPVDSAVEGGGTLKIRVTVAVPRELAPGGYWCVLTVDEVADPLSDPSGVAMRFLASVSTGVFVYVDPVVRAARISDVQLTSDRARLTLENEGNAPVGAEGRFEFLRPGENTPIATATIPRVTVLPAPIPRAILSADLPAAAVLPSGRYVVRAILDIGLEHYIGVQKEIELRREQSLVVAGR
jgi:hypothetical protein